MPHRSGSRKPNARVGPVLASGLCGQMVGEKAQVRGASRSPRRGMERRECALGKKVCLRRLRLTIAMAPHLMNKDSLISRPKNTTRVSRPRRRELSRVFPGLKKAQRVSCRGEIMPNDCVPAEPDLVQSGVGSKRGEANPKGRPNRRSDLRVEEESIGGQSICVKLIPNPACPKSIDC